MIDDNEFIRGNVPMTKQEIRVLTIAKAQIKSTDIIVDVGAGTGSLSIEAAQISDKVFAIERNDEAIGLIKKNIQKFSANNVEVIKAEAPDGLNNISTIDIALIGGSGGKLNSILDVIDFKLALNGRIVINCITIQTLAKSLEYFKKKNNYEYDAIQVQINRLQNIGKSDMLKALNPIYIVTAVKKQ